MTSGSRGGSIFSRAYSWSGLALGLAIGGFFDGIVLHQILQWHHLLSGLEGGAFGDLRFQILADGLFHALMYVVGGVGLWLLWRSREEFGQVGADRLLFSNALVGFGVWHVLDAIISHWVLGIHRIRMDTAMPLAWDIFWVVVFGLVPLLAGWLIRSDDGGPRRRRFAGPLMLSAVLLAGGAAASFPLADRGEGPIIVVFMPGTTPSSAYAAMASVDGRLIWSDRTDQVWAIEIPNGRATSLYGRGALLVSNSLVPLGCLDWYGS